MALGHNMAVCLSYNSLVAGVINFVADAGQLLPVTELAAASLPWLIAATPEV